MIALPALEGVEHRHVDVAEGVRIHVADAGPADGPAVMLVHGFPQNWWEWRDLIGPLAADGNREMLRWLRGEYNDARVDVPVRWLHGTGDPVITPDLLDGYAERASDFEVELVDGVGHWIVEQRPELVLDRVRAFLAAGTEQRD